MKFLAEKRATQLRDVSGFKDAGVYDPESIGGTSVIYVLHDINKPETYGALPKNPTSPGIHRVEGRVQATRSLWRHAGICGGGNALRL